MAGEAKLDLFGFPLAEPRELPGDADQVREIYDAMGSGEPMREIMEMFYALHGREYGLRPPVAELRHARRVAGGGIGRG
ncbi:hypothetical protein [Neorhizobium alkalisoli]|uniref:Uncharacterized protein n=1 Tax=Neorhizobium alkalisoli TaxID=528178 RepID=A0A561QS72_9HYPH|nr:hypothetical protein [Neorhizobium alkalisoli]TWF53238.1 hypothetical protein FHW37_104515 [Neorhizobium alkalisoli]